MKQVSDPIFRSMRAPGVTPGAGAAQGPSRLNLAIPENAVDPDMPDIDRDLIEAGTGPVEMDEPDSPEP